ncbi:hypothetical protein MXB_5575 [Myxobolus squamalis]|nr:hypothetical protein MXB_5575 [Myxobolus squamalis]
MARFDPAMFEKKIIVISPTQLCKIITIILLTSFTIKNIVGALRLFKTIPLMAEKQYNITPMLMSLVRGDFASFIHYFNILIPHIFNDIFLSPCAQDIIDLVVENTIINYLHQFSSVLYPSMEAIFHLPIETVEQILNEKKSPPKYLVDVQHHVQEG